MEPRQRRRKNKKGETLQAAATSVHDIPDDVLRLILLCLDSPLWLIRAACTCQRWRSFVSAGDGAILRLARSLHPPAIAGHYHHRGGPITFIPLSPPVAIDGSRFSLDFLHLDALKWKVADCHGGLVLLMERLHRLPDLIVCNPLTRRYRVVRHPPMKQAIYSAGDVFLLDGDNSGISMSKFRVFYRFDKCPWRACVFSTCDGDGWRFLPASSANNLDGNCLQVAGRVDGSLYLGLMTGSVMVLDNTTLEFSQVDLPSHVDPSPKHYSSFRVVHGAGPGPSSPATTQIVHTNGEGLEVFRRVHGSGEWVLEHSICRLSEVARGLPSYLAERPSQWVLKVIADAVGLAVLSVMDFNMRGWFFTVDVSTMEVRFAPESTYHLYGGTTATSTYTLPYAV